MGFRGRLAGDSRATRLGPGTGLGPLRLGPAQVPDHCFVSPNYSKNTPPKNHYALPVRSCSWPNWAHTAMNSNPFSIAWLSNAPVLPQNGRARQLQRKATSDTMNCSLHWLRPGKARRVSDNASTSPVRVLLPLFADCLMSCILQAEPCCGASGAALAPMTQEWFPSCKFHHGHAG